MSWTQRRENWLAQRPRQNATIWEGLCGTRARWWAINRGGAERSRRWLHDLQPRSARWYPAPAPHASDVTE